MTLIVAVLLALFPLKLSATPYPPSLKAKSAISIDIASHEIIYAKNIDQVCYPASTTKLVTAVLLAKKRQRDDLLVYSLTASREYPYVLKIPPGTRINAESAMDGLMLFSGNDIACMIAENIAGSVPHFSGMMNDYVRALGLRNTNFVNSTGLHDPEHYTTAYELSIILRDIVNYPWIMESSAKQESVVRLESGVGIPVKNRNKLAGIRGCIAGKTGWTPEAGRCLAALFERDGRLISGIILDSEYDVDDTVIFNEMLTLIEYSFTAKRIRILSPGTLGKQVTVEFCLLGFFGPKTLVGIPVIIKESFECFGFESPLSVSFNMFAINPWKLDHQSIIGSLQCRERERTATIPLFSGIATGEIIMQYIHFYMLCGFIFFLLLLVLFICIYFFGRVKKPEAGS